LVGSGPPGPLQSVVGKQFFFDLRSNRRSGLRLPDGSWLGAANDICGVLESGFDAGL